MTKTPLFDQDASLRNQSLARSDRLLRVFEDIHNHIYANEGLSSEQTFAEMMKVLLLKVCDEKGSEQKEFFILPEEFDGSKPSNLKDFEKRMKSLQEKTVQYLPDGTAKEQEVSLRLNSLAYAVDRLQHIDLLKSSRDVKGLAFQKFVCSEHRRGRG
ncbi:MAG: hypothetical protein FJY85_22760, partial [Deltaproteobacteria bacterium]|nr:hypothetical protein [Deltaproteobacteria bacterium]